MTEKMNIFILKECSLKKIIFQNFTIKFNRPKKNDIANHSTTKKLLKFSLSYVENL